MRSETALLADVADRRQSVREHKDAIRCHRSGLNTVAAQLKALEEECRRRGITLVIHRGVGEDIHGRQQARTEN